MLHKPGLDQTQPGHMVWIQSNQPSGYLTGEIGTSECEASSDLYGCRLNRETGFDPVLATLNRRISLSRPSLPPRGNPRRGVGSRPMQNGSPARGEQERDELMQEHSTRPPDRPDKDSAF